MMNKALFAILVSTPALVFAQQPDTPPKLPQPQTISTQAESKGSSLTIYNQNFAIVRDQRTINLNQGRNTVRFEDVAAQIDPTSISFKSITAPNSVAVREQNYQYDLISPASILNKSIGKKVRVMQTGANGSRTSLEGILLSGPEQGIVIRLASGELVLNPQGEVVVLETPENLVSRPSLLWRLDADRGGRHETEVSYITNGITWKSDYVAVINEDETKVDLTGWVTLDNRSGASYKDANLQLMAGDVRRVQDNVAYDAEQGAVGAEVRMQKAQAPQFQEESFFEYHLYTLEGKTDILNNETKQQTLLSASNVGVKRQLVYEGGASYGYRRGGTGDKIKIMLEVKNSEQNNMGMPLPKGKVRVYKSDKRGNMQFLGEDMIDHTPKDEEVRLYIGDAFDVVGARKRTDYRQISDRMSEESWEITIRNHKKSATDVKIVEHSWGDWEITRSNKPHEKSDANTFEFLVPVEKDAETKVTYTIRRRW